MKPKQTLKLIQQIKKEIKKDWGTCDRKDVTWTCWSCYSRIVFDFMTNWEQMIKEEIKDVKRI